MCSRQPPLLATVRIRPPALTCMAAASLTGRRREFTAPSDEARVATSWVYLLGLAASSDRRRCPNGPQCEASARCQ